MYKCSIQVNKIDYDILRCGGFYEYCDYTCRRRGKPNGRRQTKAVFDGSGQAHNFLLL